MTVGPPRTFGQRCSCLGMEVALDVHGGSRTKVEIGDPGYPQTDLMGRLAGHTLSVDRTPPSSMEKKILFPSATWISRETGPANCRGFGMPVQLGERQLDSLHGKMGLFDGCTC